MTRYFYLLAILIAFAANTFAQSKKALYNSKSYKVYPDRVVQGKNIAYAISRTHLKSNYQSPANTAFNPELEFKFSINGKDNELDYGVNHHATIDINTNGKAIIDVNFGKQKKITEGIKGSPVPANTPVTFRLNLKKVLNSFNEKGFYTDLHGNKIYKSDFKGVYIAGGNSPLTWDFDNLRSKPEMELKDPDKDGVYEVTLIFNSYDPNLHTTTEWQLTDDTTQYPQLKSDFPLIDGLYSMSLEEMLADIREDKCFMAGKKWTGVWTRDISYSIVLALAAIEPEVAKNSLMKKVKNDRIIQDTGTGGSWPVSTDRVTWALAAWEVYKVTGDSEWLNKAYLIIENSIKDDLLIAVNKQTGLFYGESSFLDWRKQSYPKWMEPMDIYLSQTLGTNVVFYRTLAILGEMAKTLNTKDTYTAKAEELRKAINTNLWQQEKGYYGQFIYGRKHQYLSPRAEALGESLAIIFDVANKKQQKALIANTPVMQFGIPCIYPQIPNIPPYHNKAIWPFVQAYWTWAAAKAKNEKMVSHGIGSMLRQGALFLTNKENMVASNGDFNGTALNSDRQLWSVAGQLSTVYRVIFGMNFEANNIKFAPFIPKAFAGNFQLDNFRYRNATFEIRIKGFGDQIETFKIDNITSKAKISANLTGKHTIEIVMNNKIGDSSIQLVNDLVSVDHPNVEISGNELKWNPIKGAVEYQIVKNGKTVTTTSSTTYQFNEENYSEFHVKTIGKKSESFFSEPVEFIPSSYIIEAELHDDKEITKDGASKNKCIELSKHHNKEITIPVEVAKTGLYSFDTRYANGNGPVNTDNKCGIRSIYINNKYRGVMIFPQRGKDEWTNWGMSNPLRIKLKKGVNHITFKYDDFNRNMNGGVNNFLLDQLRIIPISE